jgi:PTH1 family peptidyl-tRNA hydrolase
VKGVFGLGNPGPAYTLTRHNVGFQTIDLYREAHRLRRAGRIESDCLVHRAGDVLLCKPLTWMNASGRAVAAVLNAYSIAPRDVLIVHDDLDLRLGRLKIVAAGGAGTHKGMKSVLEALGTSDVPRIKIGIEIEGRTEPGEAFVLERFTPDEWSRLLPALETAGDAIDAFRGSGIDALMARFNRREGPGCRT